VVEDKKQLLTTYQCPRLGVPRWPEFSVPKMWAFAITNPRFKDYMPSGWLNGGRTPERAYFFKVLAALETDWLVDNIDRIRAERTLRRQVPPPKPATLTIAPKWAAQLMSQPFLAGKLFSCDILGLVGNFVMPLFVIPFNRANFFF
jgi:hypothetical protein